MFLFCAQHPTTFLWFFFFNLLVRRQDFELCIPSCLVSVEVVSLERFRTG